MKKIVPAIIILFLIVVLVSVWISATNLYPNIANIIKGSTTGVSATKEASTQTPNVYSFEECVNAKYLVIETSPRLCIDPKGKNFVKVIATKFIYEKSNADMIVVDSTVLEEYGYRHLVIKGKARGTWFYEANFPIQVLDGAGKVIATRYGNAEKDWMTNEFVPFYSIIAVPTSYTGELTIQLKNNNPSDLREHDASLSFSVKIEDTAQNNIMIKLYFYNELINQGIGVAQCNKEGVVPVTRIVPRSITPQDAIRTLLLGRITQEEKEGGFTTEFPLEGVTLQAASLVNGTLTLTFLDPKGKTSGGLCRTRILWNQIEATAKQFKEVKNVNFMPEELFQP